MEAVDRFWQFPADRLFRLTGSGPEGLTEDEAAQRLMKQQQEVVIRARWQKDLLLLLSQYKNPLVLLLVFAVILSFFLGEYSDSLIVLVVLLLSGLLGFWQERNAGRAVEALRALVRSRTTVRREGREREIPLEEVVPGDIILLKAGDMIPADAGLIAANDLHVNQAALTGESFPAEKMPGTADPSAGLADIRNAVFKGTSVVNGTATSLAIHTGDRTEWGRIAARLGKAAPETAFEKGIRQFGYLLMRITVIMALLVLILNLLYHKPVVDSMLFALALAVGMAPELLPAIVTITLSAGARRMAVRKVIVKKLSAIQNLGEIDILCSDKTGTLTEGVVNVEEAVGVTGVHCDKLLRYAWLNAFYQTGFSNPVDEAIRRLAITIPERYCKRDEVPYDFIRKRLSIVVEADDRQLMITKGAVANVLQCCTQVELPDGSLDALDTWQAALEDLFSGFSARGFRVIALCYKDVTGDPVINKEDETGMVFLGFLTLFDPPKAGITESLARLSEAGIALRLVTGDNRLVARQVASQIGLKTDDLVTGEDLQQMTTEALQRRVDGVQVFAEIEPVQKERIIRALQKNGHAVGYLGDGINDANALKVADVGISVDSAVDVAKEAAALVLMEKDIDVIRAGVLEGRKTFMNTLKYIFITTSANFGNMFSMAVASLALPFLPLLPTQILLNNFLSDLPALAIASDRVDEEGVREPRRWDMRYIRRFMVVFGLQSSLFDFLTFGLLLFVFHAGKVEFRTGWFMESLLTEILILLVIRTRRPFFKSRPSGYLAGAAAFTFGIALLLPYLPVGRFFDLYHLPVNLLAVILGIALVYVLMAELTKRIFPNHTAHRAVNNQS